MTLYDMTTEETYTLPKLWEEWNRFKTEEPWNHAETFRKELHNILMATINGRNDCEVVGLTKKELCDYIITIRHL